MSPDRGILRHCLRGNARTATVPRDANAGARGAFASERAKACARFGLLRTGGTQDASSVCALVCGAGPGGTYPLARHGQQIPLATSPRTVQHPLGEDFSGAQGLVPQTLDEQTALSYVRRVPVSLLKEVLLTGNPGGRDRSGGGVARSRDALFGRLQREYSAAELAERLGGHRAILQDSARAKETVKPVFPSSVSCLAARLGSGR